MERRTFFLSSIVAAVSSFFGRTSVQAKSSHQFRIGDLRSFGIEEPGMFALRVLSKLSGDKVRYLDSVRIQGETLRCFDPDISELDIGSIASPRTPAGVCRPANAEEIKTFESSYKKTIEEATRTVVFEILSCAFMVGEREGKLKAEVNPRSFCVGVVRPLNHQTAIEVATELSRHIDPRSIIARAPVIPHGLGVQSAVVADGSASVRVVKGLVHSVHISDSLTAFSFRSSSGDLLSMDGVDGGKRERKTFKTMSVDIVIAKPV